MTSTTGHTSADTLLENMRPDVLEGTAPESFHDVPVQYIAIEGASSTVKSGYRLQSTSKNPNRKRLFWYKILSGWYLEILRLFGVLCSIAAIVSLLYFYDHKPITHLPRYPGLNTIVNIISSISTALIMGVTTAALSQSKWSHYTKPRPLTHIGLVDAASRGPLGAFIALFHPRLGLFTFLGAIIVLATIAIGPSFQETISYVSQSIPDNSQNATVPIARAYAPREAHSGAGTENMDPHMQTAIIDGLLFPNSNKTAINFNCVTGNCTFLPYTTLGVCHSCQNVSVETVCGPAEIDGGIACNFSLPNGHSLLQTTSAWDWENVINVSSQVITDALSTEQEMATIVSVSTVALSNGPNCMMEFDNCIMPNASWQYFGTNPYRTVGAQCSLEFCLKSFTADISNGVAEEKIIGINKTAVFINDPAPALFYNYYIYLANPCFIDGIPHNPEAFNINDIDIDWETMNGDIVTHDNLTVPADCVFLLDMQIVNTLEFYMRDNSALFDGIGKAVYGMGGGVYMFGQDGMFNSSAFGVEAIFNYGNSSFESVDESFMNLATAMTNEMRGSGNPLNTTDIPGVLLRMETIVVISWWWLNAPAIIFICSFLYLGAVILQAAATASATDREMWGWKFNPLVLLLLGVSSTSSKVVNPLSSTKAFKTIKDVKFRLVKTENGWEMVEEGLTQSANEEDASAMLQREPLSRDFRFYPVED